MGKHCGCTDARKQLGQITTREVDEATMYANAERWAMSMRETDGPSEKMGRENYEWDGRSYNRET